MQFKTQNVACQSVSFINWKKELQTLLNQSWCRTKAGAKFINLQYKTQTQQVDPVLL